MKLNELPKVLAYSKATKRRGKGVGSGQGKTAGRGHKGGKARAGYSPAPCCSGIPFYRHLPIRGFSNARFKKDVKIVSLKQFELLNDSVIDKNVMLGAGLIDHLSDVVKVLGNEKLERPITVVADIFSEGARHSIEQAGGKVLSIEEAQVENR